MYELLADTVTLNMMGFVSVVIVCVLAYGDFVFPGLRLSGWQDVEFQLQTK